MGLLVVAAALAHHDTVVSQVGTSTAIGSTIQDRVTVPTLELELAWDSRVFARTLRGSGRFRGGTPTTVGVFGLTPIVRLRLPSQTTLALRAPTGLVASHVGDARTKLHAGPGDLGLSVAQGWRGLSVQAGATAPTGMTGTDAEVSFTDLSGQGSDLRLTTYDTRASLGTGAWTVSGGLGGRWRHERVGADAFAGAAAPLTDTRDGIRWGPTLSSRVGGTFDVMPGKLALGAGVDARHHLPDRMEVVDEVTGVPTTANFGSRTGLGVDASLTVLPTARTRCGLGARVPIWRHVAGVQLVESFAVTASCAMGWPLRQRQDA